MTDTRTLVSEIEAALATVARVTPHEQHLRDILDNHRLIDKGTIRTEDCPKTSKALLEQAEKNIRDLDKARELLERQSRTVVAQALANGGPPAAHEWSKIVNKVRIASVLGVDSRTLDAMETAGTVRLKKLSRQCWQLDLRDQPDSVRKRLAPRDGQAP